MAIAVGLRAQSLGFRLQGSIWVVNKIKVPFWVPQIIGAVS